MKAQGHSGRGRGDRRLLGSCRRRSLAALFARVKVEHGRLDIVVNNAAQVMASTTMSGGFWQKPLEAVDPITAGLRSHFMAAYHAAPLLTASGRRLIVQTGHYGAVAYDHGAAYGAEKAGADNMATDVAKELQPYKEGDGDQTPAFIPRRS